MEKRQMALKTSTLRPGLLVSLKTSLRGNVQYRKIDLEAEHLTADGSSEARWETERTIADAAEFERAKKVRGKAGSIIRAVCAQSAFGLLCPEQDADELEKALAAANKLVADFNATATLSRLSVYALVGHIAADDVTAVKAINSEIADLLSAMEGGLRALDVKAIREAANRAKGVSQMLSPTAAARVQAAIDAARSSARKLVAAGEQVAAEIDLRSIRAVTEARTAFLDLDDAGQIGVPGVEDRVLDLPVNDEREAFPDDIARDSLGVELN
jgi:hypothetical protein